MNHIGNIDQKPIIGITTYGRVEKDLSTPNYDKLLVSPQQYADSILRAGGVPVLLTPCINDWSRVMRGIDGVLFTGGADLNPATHGADPSHPSLTSIDDERDTSELELIRYLAAEGQKPVLCICRGFELINVAFGGTLHIDIDSFDSQIRHRQDDGGWVLHEIEVSEGTRMAKAMGTLQATTTSGHHQAINTLAECFEISARAPDGIIEGIEHRTHPWMVGVQWHPETTAHYDLSQQALFDAFVQQAGR